jgi:hypothetical protein
MLNYFTQLEVLENEGKDEPRDEIFLTPPEEAVQLAMNYLLDELIVMQPRPCILQISLQNEPWTSEVSSRNSEG